MEPTTPAFAVQVTSLRLTLLADDSWGDPPDESERDELAAAFFEAIRPAVEAFGQRHQNTTLVVTP